MYRAASLGIAVVALALAAPRFEDPKPPRLATIEEAPPAEPSPHPEVTFHRKPGPLAESAKTEDWPAFLGLRGEPTSRETRILKEYGADGPRLVWELAKGTGYSSPSIAGNYLVYLHRRGGNEIIECLHPETGESYWRHTYATNFEDRFGYNNGPRASPVIDGDLVYTYGAQGKLHCLRLRSGQVVWKRDIAAEFGVAQDFFGTATTPLVDEDRLILNVGAPGGPAVVALDKLDGRMLWGVGDQWGPSYATCRGPRQRQAPPVRVRRRREPSTRWRTARHRSCPGRAGLPLPVAEPELRVGQCILSGRYRQPRAGFCNVSNGRSPARNRA